MATKEKIVTDFCNALLEGSVEKILPTLAEDVFYHNVPWEPVTGHAGVRAVLKGFLNPPKCQLEKMDIKNTVVAGDVVMNERVEHWAAGKVRVALPIVGVFTFKGDKIVRWCDYFDAGSVKPLIDALG